MHMAMLLAALARGWQLLSKACLWLVALGKGWGCLLGDGSGKTAPEAPGPLVLKVDMKACKAMLIQVMLNLEGMCLGSTWKQEGDSTVARKISHTTGGAGAVGLADLGARGASGKWTGNPARDMKNKSMKDCTLPNHSEAVAPLMNKETMEEACHVFPVLLPHELLAHFVNEDPDLLVAWGSTPAGSVTHWAAFWLHPEVPGRTFQDAATGLAWRWASSASKDEGHFRELQLEPPHMQNMDDAVVRHISKKFRRRQNNFGCCFIHLHGSGDT